MKYLLFILIVMLSVPSYADFTDNLRWSIDSGARLISNNSADNTSRIYAFGIDSHKVFTSTYGDIGYAVGQLYFTKLSNQTPIPFMFDSKNDSEFVIRDAHVNYTALPNWLPNIRLGHFTLPFGLEESIDTSGRLLDYNHNKNLGTKQDWGLDLNKVLGQVEYSISYTLGGKDKIKRINDSYALSGRIGTLSHLDFVYGFSFFSGKIDNIKRRRFAIDALYYWGTWGVLGELVLGENLYSDNKKSSQWQNEVYSLIEINKTSLDTQLKLYGQFIFRNKESEENTKKLVNLGLSYQFKSGLELSLSGLKQLNSPESTNKQELVRFQLRYRY